jgi:adenylate kinase
MKKIEIYGLSGVGKSTLVNTMINNYYNEFVNINYVGYENRFPGIQYVEKFIPKRVYRFFKYEKKLSIADYSFKIGSFIEKIINYTTIYDSQNNLSKYIVLQQICWIDRMLKNIYISNFQNKNLIIDEGYLSRFPFLNNNIKDIEFLFYSTPIDLQPDYIVYCRCDDPSVIIKRLESRKKVALSDALGYDSKEEIQLKIYKASEILDASKVAFSNVKIIELDMCKSVNDNVKDLLHQLNI